MPLLVDACPSYATRFERYLAKNYDDGDERLVYCELGDFAHHLCDLLERKETSEFCDVFRAIESLHVNGDSYVREAAIIGLLEGLQNVASNRTAVTAEQFTPFLGAEATKWWHELNEFWQGGRRYVGEGLENRDNNPPRGQTT